MMKRYSYLLEALIFTAIVLLIGSFQGNPAFVGVNLHPFYLVILLIVLRYGYLKGLPSAIITSACYIGFYLRRTGSFQISDLWGDCYQPITFLAFAMFVGLVAEIDKKKIANLSNKIDELNATVARKDDEIEKISRINEHISEQLSISDQTFNLLFDKTKNLFNEDIMVVYETAYEILHKTVKATKGYMFYLEGNDFKLAYPKEQRREANQFLEANKEQVHEDVRGSREFVRLDEHASYDRSPVFLGPILHQATNTIYGMLAVEELDFLKYNESTYLTFVNLCKWLGEVLYFRSNQYAAITPVEKGAGEFNYLLKAGASRSEVKQFVQSYFQQ